MRGKKIMGLAALAVIVFGIIIGNVLSRQKEPMRRGGNKTRQKSIKVITVKNHQIETPVRMTGPLYAYNKIELFTEVTGVLKKTKKPFKEGYTFKKGECLIKVDDSVYRNNLLAQKSNLLNQVTLLLPDLSIDFPNSAKKWENYLAGLDLNKPFPSMPTPGGDKERYYIISRNIYNLFYSIKSMEATFAKYTLDAPFSGVVTQALINPGTLVRAGQKLGEFTSTGLYEMAASVNLFEANRMQTGQQVELKTGDTRGAFTGVIHRINRVLDRESMTVKVYIHTEDSRLRDGMYMQAETTATPIVDAFSVAKDLMVEPGKLFVIKDSVLELRTVEIIGEKGDQVIFRGLKDGTLLLGQPWDEAAEGVKIPDAGQGMQSKKKSSPPQLEHKE